MTASRAALHEAGHCVAAVALGREALSATIRSGRVLDGCSRYTSPAPMVLPEGFEAETTPLVLWPRELRARCEAAALICLAGDVAELLLAGPEEGRVPDPAADVAAELAASVTAGAADLAWAAGTVNSLDHRPDDVVLAQVLHAMAGRDPPAVAALSGFLENQARQLVIANEAAIRRVGLALDEYGTLGAVALAELVW